MTQQQERRGNNMLTLELLRQQEALKGLSDEQLSSIATLSKNDENTVIARRIGEIYGGLDTDIFNSSGIAKNDGEKSYDYAKRVIGKFKDESNSVQGLKGQVSTLKQDIEGYKKQIAEGKGNEAIAQQLKDVQKQLSDTKELMNKQNTDWAKKCAGLENAYKDSMVRSAFSQALNGIKLKDMYPDSVKKALIKSAEDSILAQYKADFIDDSGRRKMVFRDDKGEILNNPKNQLQPYTAAELLKESSILKDAIDTGHHQSGGGTPPKPGHTGGSGEGIDLSSARTQIQADEAISKYLMKNGYTRGSVDFASKFTEIRNDNKVGELPMTPEE